MSYETYKLFHVLGMLLIFFGLGGVAVHAAGGGQRDDNPLRKALGAAHGVGLLLLLVAGFGMLARLQLSFASGWLWAKIAIWLVLGFATMLPYRSRSLARWSVVIFPLLGLAAAYLARFKPF
ncbi:MAG: hypothetical protein R3325_07125 [Thermoanaerobaculia bacterium]|nr:hypothetical protein [Thermoanaerobaculia bacterium]